MNDKKRLRIRQRPRVSQCNFDWLAGRNVGYGQGHEQGVKDGERNFAHDRVHMLRQITELETEVAKLKEKRQKDSHTVLDAKREATRLSARVKDLEMTNAVLARDQRIDSNFLHVPPFLIVENTAIDRDKFVMHQKHMAALYGGTVTGRTPSKFPSLPQDGVFSREMLDRLRDVILRPGAWPSFARGGPVVPMRSSGLPPGNPSFHWSAEYEQTPDGEPLTELRNQADQMEEDFRHVTAQAVRDAFRMPVLTGSEMRSSEAEEGIRQASVQGQSQGVTGVAGGHSHSIDVAVRVDDELMQDAMVRLDELSATISNEGVSADEFRQVMERLARLERQMGGEETEESEGQEDIDS